jgi:colicin import membrane protein
MNFKNVGSVIAAVAALLAQGAFAQTATPEVKARADVKAETAAAKKKGEVSPGGEGTPQEKPGAKSTKARADVKAETAAAAKKGELTKGGEGMAQEKPGPKSTKARAEVKAEAAAAKKKGEAPIGEGAPAVPVKK